MNVSVSRSVGSTSWDSMDCSPPGSSAHGILHAGILEWVAISFTREDLSDSGIKPKFLTSPALADRFFTTSTTWKAPSAYYLTLIEKWEKTVNEKLTKDTWFNGLKMKANATCFFILVIEIIVCKKQILLSSYSTYRQANAQSLRHLEPTKEIS